MVGLRYNNCTLLENYQKFISYHERESTDPFFNELCKEQLWQVRVNELIWKSGEGGMG